MTTDIVHLSREQLEAGLEHMKAAPVDHGTLALIVQRPADDVRVVLDVA